MDNYLKGMVEEIPEKRERMFCIKEVEDKSLYGDSTLIPESELRRRIEMITGGDFREGDIQMLLDGEGKEKEVAHLTKCTCERCTGIAIESLYEKQPESSSPTRKDWEEWAEKCETAIIMQDDIKEFLLAIPCSKEPDPLAYMANPGWRAVNPNAETHDEWAERMPIYGYGSNGQAQWEHELKQWFREEPLR